MRLARPPADPRQRSQITHQALLALSAGISGRLGVALLLFQLQVQKRVFDDALALLRGAGAPARIHTCHLAYR